jgi:D-alanyl-D-alanine carboxypeptidase/D-alanyl-D-alanine-endopeptidase (penicillin-binding protein 4)
MKTIYLLLSLFVHPFVVSSQIISKKLEAAVSNFLSDSQMKNAVMSLHIVNSKTGGVVYSKNSSVGLSAASSQKVITAVTAFELLGKDYKFKTELGYNGEMKDGMLNGNLFVVGYGDPTLGSWRYPTTKADVVLKRWVNELARAGIKTINGDIYLDDSEFSFQPIPGGWIWDDIGNYYGAGHWGLNWHENQYDLILKPGSKEGDAVEILRSEPQLQASVLINQLKTGKKGSGDNGYIYLPPYSVTGFVNGTIPAGEKEFIISGSFPNPSIQFDQEMNSALQQAKIGGNFRFKSSQSSIVNKEAIPKASTILSTIYSPPLDSVVYWFLKKSINLYGEALVKTMAYEKQGFGSTESGLSLVYDFWRTRGVDSNSIKMMDGSGLSPQNRITSDAFVKVMQYARGRSWFPSFYNALPEFNGLKMKSGTIGGAKSFTGYSKSANGAEYTFAIVVNNYNGISSQIISKMYKVLDVLK